MGAELGIFLLERLSGGREHDSYAEMSFMGDEERMNV